MYIDTWYSPVSDTTFKAPTPTQIAQRVPNIRFAAQAANIRMNMERRASARAKGYNGPLTRAELAARIRP